MNESTAGVVHTFVVVAGGGAALGAAAGIVVALLLTGFHAPTLLAATAFDTALGGAMIGGLIGANIAGTD